MSSSAEWWDSLYATPAGTSPDTGPPTPTPGSVDDWFDSVDAMIRPADPEDPEADGERGGAAGASGALRAPVVPEHAPPLGASPDAPTTRLPHVVPPARAGEDGADADPGADPGADSDGQGDAAPAVDGSAVGGPEGEVEDATAEQPGPPAARRGPERRVPPRMPPLSGTGLGLPPRRGVEDPRRRLPRLGARPEPPEPAERAEPAEAPEREAAPVPPDVAETVELGRPRELPAPTVPAGGEAAPARDGGGEPALGEKDPGRDGGGRRDPAPGAAGLGDAARDATERSDAASGEAEGNAAGRLGGSRPDALPGAAGRADAGRGIGARDVGARSAASEGGVGGGAPAGSGRARRVAPGPAAGAPLAPRVPLGLRAPRADGGASAAPAGEVPLAVCDPDRLAESVPDTVLESGGHGGFALRGASVRGSDARADGRPRRDHLLMARFGEGTDALLLAVVASAPDPEVPDSGTTATACRRLAAAVGHARQELLADLRAGAQERLRFGLQRLTAAAARRLPPPPDAPPSSSVRPSGMHALLLPGDGRIRPRVGFGVGPGAFLLLDGDTWFDAYAGMRLAEATEPPRAARFRFRVAVPEPGDVLLVCSGGFAEPVRRQDAVSRFLSEHWAAPNPPDDGDFLRQVQVPAQGHGRDRTAVAVWEV